MQILTTPQQLAAQCRAWHKAGDDIALVPTMATTTPDMKPLWPRVAPWAKGLW